MRPDDPDPRAIQALVERNFPGTPANTVERVAEGVSTRVYRIRGGAETFYLRVLPEVGATLDKVQADLTLHDQAARASAARRTGSWAGARVGSGGG
jgi:hypothetical protein